MARALAARKPKLQTDMLAAQASLLDASADADIDEDDAPQEQAPEKVSLPRPKANGATLMVSASGKLVSRNFAAAHAPTDEEGRLRALAREVYRRAQYQQLDWETKQAMLEVPSGPQLLKFDGMSEGEYRLNSPRDMIERFVSLIAKKQGAQKAEMLRTAIEDAAREYAESNARPVAPAKPKPAPEKHTDPAPQAPVTAQPAAPLGLPIETAKIERPAKAESAPVMPGRPLAQGATLTPSIISTAPAPKAAATVARPKRQPSLSGSASKTQRAPATLTKVSAPVEPVELEHQVSVGAFGGRIIRVAPKG